MKLKEVFEKSVQFFKDKKIETARLDAELLIAHALKIERVQIYVKYEQPLKEEEISLCRESIRRRSAGEPVAYIIGEKGFYGLTFKVGAGVLIPRPETESIVEDALLFIKQKKLENPRILDLGAGTGCIGLSILKNANTANLVCVEKSPEAYKYLVENTANLKLDNRTQTILNDIEELNFADLGHFDIVVSNPPYIANGDAAVEENVKKFEPSAALYAEEKGLYFIKSWITKSIEILKKDGLLLFEIGSTQGAQARHFAEDKKIFSEVRIIKDLSGLDRTLKCVR